MYVTNKLWFGKYSLVFADLRKSIETYLLKYIILYVPTLYNTCSERKFLFTDYITKNKRYFSNYSFRKERHIHRVLLFVF